MEANERKLSANGSGHGEVRVWRVSKFIAALCSLRFLSNREGSLKDIQVHGL